MSKKTSRRNKKNKKEENIEMGAIVDFIPKLLMIICVVFSLFGFSALGKMASYKVLVAGMYMASAVSLGFSAGWDRKPAILWAAAFCVIAALGLYF